jgi:hypothetical protein
MRFPRCRTYYQHDYINTSAQFAYGAIHGNRRSMNAKQLS